MARARIVVHVDDRAGNVIQNARVFIRENGTSTPVADLYAAASGGSPQASLVSDAYGDAIGYLAAPRDVRVVVTDNSDTCYYPAAPAVLKSFTERTRDNVPVDENPTEEAAEDAAVQGVRRYATWALMTADTSQPDLTQAVVENTNRRYWWDDDGSAWVPEDRGFGVVNVLDYGAVCDDVTDDSAAILAACTEAAADGATVVFPQVGGVGYRCSVNLKGLSGIRLLGMGRPGDGKVRLTSYVAGVVPLYCHSTDPGAPQTFNIQVDNISLNGVEAPGFVGQQLFKTDFTNGAISAAGPARTCTATLTNGSRDVVITNAGTVGAFNAVGHEARLVSGMGLTYPVSISEVTDATHIRLSKPATTSASITMTVEAPHAARLESTSFWVNFDTESFVSPVAGVPSLVMRMCMQPDAVIGSTYLTGIDDCVFTTGNMRYLVDEPVSGNQLVQDVVTCRSSQSEGGTMAALQLMSTASTGDYTVFERVAIDWWQFYDIAVADQPLIEVLTDKIVLERWDLTRCAGHGTAPTVRTPDGWAIADNSMLLDGTAGTGIAIANVSGAASTPFIRRTRGGWTYAAHTGNDSSNDMQGETGPPVRVGSFTDRYATVGLAAAGRVLYGDGSTSGWKSLDDAGDGSPEGVVTANVGSTYRRWDGGAITGLYLKASGTGNTGWVQILGFTPGAAMTQTYATADATLGAYTSDPESGAYTGIDNAQGGTPYAQLTDLNALRVAYENLRAFTEDLAAFTNSLVDKLQAIGLVG